MDFPIKTEKAAAFRVIVLGEKEGEAKARSLWVSEWTMDDQIRLYVATTSSVSGTSLQIGGTEQEG